MNSDTKNFILAIALIVGRHRAVADVLCKPALREAQQQAAQQQICQGHHTATGGTGVPQAPAAGAGNAACRRRPRARRSCRARHWRCRAKPRSSSRRAIQIDTPTVSGSINLKGARLDDLRLKEYHETVDDTRRPSCCCRRPTRRRIFRRAGLGRAARPDQQTARFGHRLDRVRQTATLTPSTPVTLNWDNGEGLIF